MPAHAAVQRVPVPTMVDIQTTKSAWDRDDVNVCSRVWEDCPPKTQLAHCPCSGTTFLPLAVRQPCDKFQAWESAETNALLCSRVSVLIKTSHVRSHDRSGLATRKSFVFSATPLNAGLAQAALRGRDEDSIEFFSEQAPHRPPEHAGQARSLDPQRDILKTPKTTFLKTPKTTFLKKFPRQNFEDPQDKNFEDPLDNIFEEPQDNILKTPDQDAGDTT